MKTRIADLRPWMMSIGVIAIASVFFSASCKHVTGGAPKATIMFYNVENLFDTQDDPKTEDGDFTPGGKLAWDEARYKTKLTHIAEVIHAVDANLPDVVGLCEVENEGVLKDLVNESLIKGAKYKIVHFDSPDERGIDVALLYKSSSMKLISSKAVHVTMPDVTDHTRDILYVKGELGGEVMHFFVNHWPSRSKGQMETEPDRMAAASALRHQLDSITALDPKAKVVCMGDLNDHPDDKSVATTLGAGPSSEELQAAEKAEMPYAYHDWMWALQQKKEGTHYYKGEWGVLDHFVTTNAFTSKCDGWKIADGAHIFRGDLVMFTDKEGNKRPNRTYVGNDYKGGYSDHMPIYLSLFK